MSLGKWAIRNVVQNSHITNNSLNWYCKVEKDKTVFSIVCIAEKHWMITSEPKKSYRCSYFGEDHQEFGYGHYNIKWDL